MKVIIIALAVISLIVGGCTKPAESIPATEPSKTAQQPVSSASADSHSLTTAFRNLAAIKTYKAKMVSDRRQEGTIQTSVSAVLPDRFHLINSAIELKVIGDEAFRKFPDGRWQKLPKISDATNLIDPARLEQYISSATEVKLIGSEDLNGLSQIYEARFDHIPASRTSHGQIQPYVARVWVGQSDGLPRKFEGEEVVSQVKTAIFYYDYNDTGITIKPPAN
ncbi:MAG TPA: hypothetical protein VJX74_01735 [Blastocatellia bacterium]|nr:hypothetical protein [Blastocatellia bacterium]